jgi:hypothetical protein
MHTGDHQTWPAQDALVDAPEHTPSPSPLPSQLIFDDSDLLLTIGAIWVSGRLSMGSPDCRLQSSIMLTFSAQFGIGDADLGIQVRS